MPERQAKKLLELFGSERKFSVQVLDDAEATALKREFEKLGCRVEMEPFKPRMDVYTKAAAKPCL
jgi:hypothetical protein